ncbi:acyl carrier protein [Buchnera aphidicola (Cinara tujafilina)]|uniref:Acyl carrier protein n=1 Tax=Buchnera aphidicola (Cinara tujafilina) TaxID=261317 RepID=F7WZF0_9GAMM|nr:acyl carrier protein [Buchnera aphidicola]AEH39812.1 acyl carrier protein [Buchnera aphidicola (Cinara tujafilina)]
MKNIQNKIISIIAKQFQKKEKEISLKDSFLNNFKADSLDFVELIMLIEDEFKIEVIDIDFNNIKTVEQFINIITKLIK